MAPRDTFPQHPGGGHIEPMSPVDVARMKLSENPIWHQNRPGHWGRGKNALYHGVFLIVIALAAAGIVGTTSFGALSIGAMWTFSLLLCVIQCLGTFFLLDAFDFLRSRKGSLEEIALTGLGISDIAYGSYGAATRAAAFLLGPILVAEIWMWVEFDWRVGLLALLLLPPFRWLLYCHALNYSLKRLTSLRPVDALFLVTLPFLCTIQAALCVFLGFLAIPTFTYLLGPREMIQLAVLVLLLFAILGYIVAIAWGQMTLTRGWHAATENLYQRMEQ